MAKYIDADFLWKEIEKYIKEVKDAAEKFTLNMGFFDAKLSGIHDVMAIRSLQQEQPCEDLEEAAENYAEKHGFRVPYDGSEKFYDETDVKASKDGFKAGAEWQKEQMISALKNDGELPIEFIDKFHEIDRNAFQNGQKNVKEQMLKDAVEGLICVTITGTDAISFLSPLPKELTAGDKVKIIIVKEGDE